MAKAKKYPGGLSLVYSRMNAAWFVMWHDQVLRIFNRKDEAEDYIKELTDGATTEAEHEAILREKYLHAYEPNAQHLPGSEVYQRLQLLDIGAALIVDGEAWRRTGRQSWIYDRDGNEYSRRDIAQIFVGTSQHEVSRPAPPNLWWTSAPEDYDYNYVDTVARDVPDNKSKRLYRLIQVNDPEQFEFQRQRYSSGLHGSFRADSEEAEYLGLPSVAELSADYTPNASHTVDKVISAATRLQRASAGAFKTEDGIVYSYNLPIGNLQLGNGPWYVLDKRESPSVTTSKHIGYLMRGLPANQIVVVPDVLAAAEHARGVGHTPNGTRTPWGPAQQSTRLARGITAYSTSSHGGVGVTQKAAAEMLSDAAIEAGMRWGNKFWYEEDIDVAILVLELPDLFPKASPQEAFMFLSGWHPEYLSAIGRTPDQARYAQWQERQEEDRLRSARSPDLVIAAQNAGPGVVKVWTADGAQHFVTKESYGDREAHRMRLSRMEVVR